MNLITSIDYISILPSLVLTGFGLIVMIAEAFMRSGGTRRALGWISLLGCIAAIAASAFQIKYGGATGFFGAVRVDAFSIFFSIVVIAVSALVILSSIDYLEEEVRIGEYYALILMGTVGMCLMASAVELVLLFIALEISSISTYVLAGIRRHVAVGTESSLKYFLLGSFATAFFLYGVALIFGATGTTNVVEIARTLRLTDSGILVYLGVALMFVGLGFKVAAAPFHIWTPDVYEGSPAPVVALMSTGPKAAAFALLARVLFGAGAPGWFWLVWVAAALSMTLGNIGALVQNNVKRMLAYSSIAHAGYLLVAFAAAPQIGVSAALFYSASYAAMNVGAFAIVSHLASTGERYVTIGDYAGLARRSPLLATTLTIFMLSLIGIPLTGGFFAKFYVFTAALDSNLVWLTLIGLMNSAIAAYYYLRVVVAMYMWDEEVSAAPVPRASFALLLVLLVTVSATLYLGIFPGSVLDYAERAAADLLGADVAGLKR